MFSSQKCAPINYLSGRAFFNALRLPLILSIFCLSGSHLAFLQTAAWLHMAFEFSRTAPFTSALQKTLDGEHPCALCLRIRKTTAASDALKAGVRETFREALLPHNICYGVTERYCWTPFTITPRTTSHDLLPDLPPPRPIHF